MHFRLPAALAMGLILAAPAWAQDTSADTVLATVNGRDITVGHMIVARSRLPQQYQQLPDEALFDALLDQLVQQAALADQAGEPSKEVSLILDNERRALVAAEAIGTIVEEAVTEETLKAAYDAAFAEQRTEYNAAHILFDEGNEAGAREVLAEIEGGADFNEMAREHSTGPSGPNGGELDWFQAESMVPEFGAAVAEMSPGEVAGPIKTQFGWHLIKLNDTRPAEAPPMEAVQGQLEETIRRTAVEAALSEAEAAADVTRADLSGIDRNVLSNTELLTE